MSKLVSQNPPSEWRIKKIGEVCRIRKREKGPSLKEIAHIPMENILKDGIFAEYIVKETSKIKSGDVCKEGDILLAKITPSFENGKQGFVPQIPTDYAITTTEALPIVCSEQVDPFYIFYNLKNPLTRTIIASKMEGSTGRQRVPSDIVLNYRIPVPPLVEQRDIVEVLTTVDECIRFTDLVIKKTEELKRGLMQRLITRGINHERFKETKLGLIPEEWDVVKIGEITLDHKQGFYTSQSYSSDGVRLVRITDLLSPRISYETTPFLTLDKKTIEEFKVSKGDFLVARSGASIGRYSIATSDIPSVFGSYIIRFRFNSSIDEKIESERLKRDHMTNLKKGLIQILLSGEVRVELGEDGLHRIRDG